ncbi:hypothetical protein HKX48_001848, partial [Thoreauomyces humboldtii]
MPKSNSIAPTVGSQTTTTTVTVSQPLHLSSSNLSSSIPKDVTPLAALREALAKTTIPPADVPSTWYLSGYLSHHGDNVPVALAAIQKLVVWRREYGWNDLVDSDPGDRRPRQPFRDELSQGKVYFKGRDKEGFPVLVWRMDRHACSRNREEVERGVRFLVWVLGTAVKNGIIATRVTLLIDRLTTTQTESLSFLTHASILKSAFPEIVSRVVVFPAGIL